jgi:hypothetical protein
VVQAIDHYAADHALADRSAVVREALARLLGVDTAIPGVVTDFGCLLPTAHSEWQSVPICVAAEETWRAWADRKTT